MKLGFALKHNLKQRQWREFTINDLHASAQQSRYSGETLQ